MKIVKFFFRFLIIFALVFVVYAFIYNYKVGSSPEIDLQNTFLASNEQTSSLDSEDLVGEGVRNTGLTENNINKDGFYIRIDAIDLFKPVVKNVDPRYKDVYQQSWQTGVSHGKFTATPDQIGNVYFFAHAVSNIENMLKENAWFTEIDLLEENDEIVVYYQGKKYTYQVSRIYAVDPNATGVYTGVSSVPKVTLQTCGPPRGSLSSRYMIEALQTSVNSF